MKVELDIIGNSQCNQYFEDTKLDRGIIESQLCAGVLSGGKDTCNGDSGKKRRFVRIFIDNFSILGGPIQVTTADNACLYHIIGITSFGSPFCGQRNSPGVYTRTSSYLDWIEEKVWR